MNMHIISQSTQFFSNQSIKCAYIPGDEIQTF